WFGLAKIGAVMVPVNTAQKGELLRYILDQSDAEAVVTDATLLPRILEIEALLGKLKLILTSRSDGTGRAAAKALDLSAFAEKSVEPPSVDVRHSDPMTILFTSGTTGPSKGVVMSHHYYYYAAQTIGWGMGNRADDVLYTCLPLFHVNAQVCTVLSALLYDA